MKPVDWHFFDLPLNWYYRDTKHFAKLVTQLNPESKLYRVCRLIQMANEWVLTPNGDRRVEKEKQMLDYAAKGGPVEREFLTTKVNALIATKALEYGPYVPPGK